MKARLCPSCLQKSDDTDQAANRGDRKFCKAESPFWSAAASQSRGAMLARCQLGVLATVGAATTREVSLQGVAYFSRRELARQRVDGIGYKAGNRDALPLNQHLGG